MENAVFGFGKGCVSDWLFAPLEERLSPRTPPNVLRRAHEMRRQKTGARRRKSLLR